MEKVPAATVLLLEDKLETGPDQLQPLEGHSILATQQNIWEAGKKIKEWIRKLYTNRYGKNCDLN